jgi:hypothetical protein
MGRLMILFRLAVIVACCLCCGCSGSDIVQMDFRDLSEAKEEGVLREGGWLPQFLPSTSKNIRLRYDVDTNEVWVAFQWDGAQLQPFDAQCTRISSGELTLARKRPRTWWPTFLSKESATTPTPTAFEYFKCSDGGFAALSSRDENSYYWFEPRE